MLVREVVSSSVFLLQISADGFTGIWAMYGIGMFPYTMR